MKEKLRKVTRLMVVVILALMLVYGCTSKAPESGQLMGGGYGCAVYTEQGCAKMVVASGGEIEVLSGGTVDIQSGSTFGLSGTLGLTPPLTLDGSTDAVQLTVQGHSTQTAKTFVVETSAGTDKFTVDNSGNLVAAGNSTLSGEYIASAAALTPSNLDTLTIAASFNVINSSGNITITLGTTNAVAGQMLWLYGDDAYTVLIADTNIRTHDGAALSLGQYDLIYMIFSGTEWIQITETANQ